jgi:hypothetical protein
MITPRYYVVFEIFMFSALRDPDEVQELTLMFTER